MYLEILEIRVHKTDGGSTVSGTKVTGRVAADNKLFVDHFFLKRPLKINNTFAETVFIQ